MVRGTTITQKQTKPGNIPVVAGGIAPTYCHNASNRPAGTITVSASGANAGFVNRYETEIFASDCSTVNAKDDAILLQEFAYRFLQSQQELINTELRRGAAQPHVYASELAELRIPVPPLEEQRRIVVVLDEAFAAIATATANAEKNLANAREILLDTIDKQLAAEGRNWIQTTIAEICSNLEYGTSAKSQPEGLVPVLRMGNLQNGEIDWADLVFTSDANDIDRLALKPLDVLFNRTNSLEHVGKTAVVRDSRRAIFAGYLIRLHYIPDLVDPEFLNLYLNSRRVREYGRSVAGKSVNQANISGGKLKTYPVNLPPLIVQRDIVTKISELRTYLERLQDIQSSKICMLTALKQSLLQRAFSGQLAAATSELITA